MNLFAREIPVSIEDEMRTSYMDYAMSVIIGRALPDVRDGLKPVHRRILFAMYDLNNVWNKPYKKSARVVGDVIGKYHPHGDMAVYETIVRMAQDFSMRYPLIDGQGNFGSIDGDPPAAMRYTEVRMARLASELLEDIDKETVDFIENYDGSLKEPVVLPSKIPNLLINGSSGIAVGMATNIPPHNMGEVIDGIIALINNPEITIGQLMHYIPGPDFPTGGFIHGQEGIINAYKTGRGTIQMRAKYDIEEHKKGEKKSIVITEIPYQVNKSKLIEKIAELSKEKKIDGVSEVRDESDREGMRIVIELKKDVSPQVILNQLYKHTPLQETFGIIMLAVVNNEPKILNLKEILTSFINFRKEIITRKTQFELRKAKDKAHLLEGLTKALDNLEGVIKIVKESLNTDEAQENLMKLLALTEKQSQSILEMKLQRLTSLERKKIVEDYVETLKLISKFEEILSNPKLILNIIIEELKEIKEKYSDKRKSIIFYEETPEITLEDIIADEDVVVTVTHEGYIKRSPKNLYPIQKRGGKGRIGMNTKEGDFVEHLFIASTHSYILCFTDLGRLHWLKVYNIPEGNRTSRGKAIVNLLQLLPGDKLQTILPVKEFTQGQYVVMVTKRGIIKKTDLMAFSNPSKAGIKAINLEEGDELISADITNGNQEIFLGTKKGLALRFHENTIPLLGRNAKGVKTITSKNDEIVGMEVLTPGKEILTVTEKGFGKRTPIDEYPLRVGRRGKGVITIKTSEKNGNVVGVYQVTDEDDIMIITNHGKIIHIEVKGIRQTGRSAVGVTLIDLEEDEKVVSVGLLAAKEEEENGNNGKGDNSFNEAFF